MLDGHGHQTTMLMPRISPSPSARPQGMESVPRRGGGDSGVRLADDLRVCVRTGVFDVFLILER